MGHPGGPFEPGSTLDALKTSIVIWRRNSRSVAQEDVGLGGFPCIAGHRGRMQPAAAPNRVLREMSMNGGVLPPGTRNQYPEPMLERFRHHLAERGLIVPGERVLVGYSGGADSTCLLHLLHLSGVDLVAAHLHHGQRDEADAEAKLCEVFCNELGVPFATGRANVPEMSRILKMGLEEAGRHARYEFFRQAAFRLQCTKIATAHTRDDHIETVLLNITRGCGIAGLAGIPETRESIIRPLLTFAREETRTYCRERGLWTHDDPANFDISFARARVRHRILPELRSINPAVDESLFRLAEIADEEDQYLDAHAIHGVESAEIPLNGTLRFLTIHREAAFERPVLQSAHPVPLRRALRLIAKAIGGDLDHRQTEIVTQGILGLEPGAVTCEGGEVVIEWDENRVHIRELISPEPFRYPFTAPGAIDSDEFGWTLQAEPAGAPFPSFPREHLDVVIDRAKVQGPLYFRSAEAGDKLVPMGFSGTRKVADLMRDAHLTGAARRRLPIICDILGIVWVPGVSLADRVKAGPDTAHGLRLRFGPLETGGHSLA